MSSSSEPLCVILTGPTWGSALHALRSAKSAGAQTHAVVVDAPTDVLRASRHCEAVSTVASDGGFDEKLLAVLNTIADSAPQTLVIPLADGLAAALDRVRKQLVASVQVCLADTSVLASLLNKSDAAARARSAGLNVPNRHAVASSPDIKRALELSFPVVVKPESSDLDSGDCQKVETYHAPGDLSQRLSELVKQEAHVIVQERVVAAESASEFGLVWVSSDGGQRQICTGRRLRLSSAGGGVMVYGTAEELADVRRETEQFLDATGFVGLGGSEFIRKDGQLHFVEFNPRLEAIHFLANAAGVDLVGSEVATRLFGATLSQSAQGEASGWVGSAALERLRTDPGSALKLAGDRFRLARSAHGVRAVVSLDDPKPALALMRLLASSAFGGRGGKR